MVDDSDSDSEKDRNRNRNSDINCVGESKSSSVRDCYKEVIPAMIVPETETVALTVSVR